MVRNCTLQVFFIIGCVSFMCMMPSNGNTQTVAKITVGGPAGQTAVPVYTDLNKLTSAPDSVLQLYQVVGNEKKPVPFQIEHSYHSRLLWWMLPAGGKKKENPTVYELSRIASPKPPLHPIRVSEDGEKLTVTFNDREVLQYNYGIVYPPAGVDTIFRRSGFIHPLRSPAGHILTRISPPDHYHHFGIWNPWTKVRFKNKTVDFWNLNQKQGTVRFSKFITVEEGPVYGRFTALQEHVAFDSVGGGEEIALNETWDVRVYNAGENIWLWDLTSTLNCATEDPVVLQEYRYGGFGFRATEEWTNRNSRVLTSEGKSRKEADAANARWCIVEGQIGNGRSGIVFMGHPANYNFPEPTRVWPENANGGRGDVFFSFSPTRNMDWKLEPGKQYVLKYRMLVYDGTMDASSAEEAWKGFGIPVKTSIIQSSR